MEQTETTYDPNGNPSATITRQRFDNATLPGPLGTPTSGVAARVYYAGAYYDRANRLTATVDAGTNGGTPWSPPSAPPTGALETSYSYSPAGEVQDVTDPRGIKTRTLYDALGRTTETIANYTGGTETNTSDVATEYTYDGDNHVVTQTAVQPSGTPSQTTAFAYGVTGVIASNDLLAATIG